VGNSCCLTSAPVSTRLVSLCPLGIRGDHRALAGLLLIFIPFAVVSGLPEWSAFAPWAYGETRGQSKAKGKIRIKNEATACAQWATGHWVARVLRRPEGHGSEEVRQRQVKIT
jgi:hypothetical protein